MAKREFAYSHFTQNSVVHVNWHINKKKKNEIWHKIIVRKLKKKKVFWGRGAYRNAVAQGPLDILRCPDCMMLQKVVRSSSFHTESSMHQNTEIALMKTQSRAFRTSDWAGRFTFNRTMTLSTRQEWIIMWL